MTPKKFENQYLKREIEGKTNLEIVVMLYDAGLKFMRQAIAAIDEKQVETSHKKIVKAQNIIAELMNMLDMEKGGDISANLRQLYSFINDRLMKANINKDSDSISEAMEIFAGLRESWVELMKQEKNGTLDDTVSPKRSDSDDNKDMDTGGSASDKRIIRGGGYGGSSGRKKGTPRKPFSING